MLNLHKQPKPAIVERTVVLAFLIASTVAITATPWLDALSRLELAFVRCRAWLPIPRRWP